MAYSRLRLARESDDKGGEALSRKSEMCGMVEMLKEYLHVTKSNKDETEELEELAGRLSLSETSEQVCLSDHPLGVCLIRQVSL